MLRDNWRSSWCMGITFEHSMPINTMLGINSPHRGENSRILINSTVKVDAALSAPTAVVHSLAVTTGA